MAYTTASTNVVCEQLAARFDTLPHGSAARCLALWHDADILSPGMPEADDMFTSLRILTPSFTAALSADGSGGHLLAYVRLRQGILPANGRRTQARLSRSMGLDCDSSQSAPSSSVGAYSSGRTRTQGAISPLNRLLVVSLAIPSIGGGISDIRLQVRLVSPLDPNCGPSGILLRIICRRIHRRKGR